MRNRRARIRAVSVRVGEISSFYADGASDSGVDMGGLETCGIEGLHTATGRRALLAGVLEGLKFAITRRIVRIDSASRRGYQRQCEQWNDRERVGRGKSGGTQLPSCRRDCKKEVAAL